MFCKTKVVIAKMKLCRTETGCPLCSLPVNIKKLCGYLDCFPHYHKLLPPTK